MKQNNNKIGVASVFGRAVLVTIFFILVVSAPTAADDSIGYSEGAIMITDYRVTPEILMPKETGILTVTIENRGGMGVKIDDVTLHSRDLESLSDDYSNVGVLGPGASNTFLFKFKAPYEEGIYFPEIWIEVIDANTSSVRMIRYPILLNVNTEISTIKEPAIEVEKIVPDFIKPGYKYEISLKLTNKGLGRANDINVQILTDSSIPISLKSPNNYYIEGIEPGESYRLNVEFISDINAELGLYSIPIGIEYTGISGAKKTQGEIVGVQIKGGPEISIASISHDPEKISVGDFVTLAIKVENTGTGDAKSVKASIDLPFEGVKSVFLGKIEPDENIPAVFTFDATQAGTSIYNVVIEYVDSDGWTREVTQGTELIVHGSESIPFSTLMLPIFSAIVVVGFAVILSSRSSKKEK